MEKKYIFGVTALILVVGAALVGWGWSHQGQKADNLIRVGAILPLSGDLAFIGGEMQKGMELALKEQPDAGIRIVYEDDQTFDLKSSVNAANKLINSDHAQVILNSAVNTTKALAPILTENKVPGIVVWDGNKTIDGLGGYVFGNGFSTELAGEKMAEFAYGKLGARHVAVVSAFDEWSEIISQAFVDKFKALGGNIDIWDKVKLDEKDLRVNAAKIKDKESEAIFLPLFLQSFNSLAKQSRDLGYKGYFLTGDGMLDSDIQALGIYSEGIYLTQAWVSDSHFIQEYKDQYGQDAAPLNIAFAGLGYDSAKLIIEVVKSMKGKGIEITPQNIRDNLAGFKFEGVTGATDFSQGAASNKKEALLQVIDGKFVKVNEDN